MKKTTENARPELREKHTEDEKAFAPASDLLNEMVDEASRESFPASDPPAWIWRRYDKK